MKVLYAVNLCETYKLIKTIVKILSGLSGNFKKCILLARMFHNYICIQIYRYKVLIFGYVFQVPDDQLTFLHYSLESSYSD